MRNAYLKSVVALAVIAVGTMLGCGKKGGADSATVQKVKQELGPDFKLEMDTGTEPAPGGEGGGTKP